MNRYDIAKDIPDDPDLKKLRKKQRSYEEAGLIDKAQQCEFDMRSLIISKKNYQHITIASIYKEFFGHEAILQPKNLSEEHIKEIKLGALIAIPYLRGPRLTETQLWNALDSNSYRFVGHDRAREEFLRRLLPHLLKDSTRELVKGILANLEKKRTQPPPETFIRIEEWSKSSASINISEIAAIKAAIKESIDTKLFDYICTAYGGLIKKGQSTDTIVMGVIADEWPVPHTILFNGLEIKGEFQGSLFKIARIALS